MNNSKWLGKKVLKIPAKYVIDIRPSPLEYGKDVYIDLSAFPMQYKGETGDLWEVGLPKDHPIFEDKESI